MSASMIGYHEILERAHERGKQLHPDAAPQRHAAFANSVAYAVTGGSGGYGGPSMREHRCSQLIAARVGPGRITFEAAVELLEGACYGPLTPEISRMGEIESCFDDDPADLAQLSE